MRYYVKINGVSSLTIPGLAIRELPPISKTLMRNQKETIDGRNGDIITELGYSAYDKTLEIGLYGSYDINQIIAFFNQKGTIVVSDEDDKYYNFTILEQIDYDKLLKFRTAKVKIHCQPFKYPLEETPIEVAYEYVEGTGTNVTLDNTKVAKLGIELKGDTSQNTTTGKQLFNKEAEVLKTTNCTYTYSDGIYTLTNTNTNNFSIDLALDLPAGSYVLNSEISLSTATQIRDNSSTLYNFGVNYSNQSFTISSTATVIRFNFGTSSTPVTLNLNTLMISVSGGDYEPYTAGASPNPSYPQNIEVVTGNNTINVCSENLFDKSNSTFISKTVGSNTRWGYKLPKMANNFYASKQVNDSAGFRIFEDINGVMTGAIPSSIATTPVLVTNTDNDFYLLCTSTSNKAIAEGNFSNNNFMISYKNITYVPYTGQTYPINLGSLELCKIGDYQDYIYGTPNNWKKYKAIGKKAFIGEEEISYNSGNQVFYSAVSDASTSIEFTPYCNYFTGQSRISAFSDLQNNKISFRASTTYVFFKNTSITSANDFKTWLSTHNTIVYYILDTPAEEAITEPTLVTQLNDLYNNAVSYLDQTNILTTGNLPIIITATALKNGSDEATINNVGNVYSKPLIELEGTGTVGLYLDDTQLLSVDMSTYNNITIDTENMEAYDPNTNQLRNRQVIGDYNNIKLPPGETTMLFDGALTKATISKFKRWL